MWRKMDFLDAVEELLKTFDQDPEAVRLALVWRAPGEWTVMDEWLLHNIKGHFYGATLRVVLWLTRPEAGQLMSVYRRKR